MKTAGMDSIGDKASSLAAESIGAAKDVGKAAYEGARDSYDNARDSIAGKASALAADSIEVAKEAGKAAYDSARENAFAAYDNARQSAQVAASVAKEKSDVALKEVSTAISARPLTSVAIAAAVGFAIACYLRR